jgi:hypothetical protein
MTALSFLLLFLFLLFRQAVVATKNTKLNLRLAQNSPLFEILAMLHEVGDVQQLLVELLIGHQLLKRNEIPVFEAALKVFV